MTKKKKKERKEMPYYKENTTGAHNVIDTVDFRIADTLHKALKLTTPSTNAKDSPH